jgi:hypothetical protein
VFNWRVYKLAGVVDKAPMDFLSRLCALFLVLVAGGRVFAQGPFADPPALMKVDALPLAGEKGKSSQVVIVHDPHATIAFAPQEGPVEAMFKLGFLQATRKPTVKEAWLSLVTTQDVVGIKVYSAPGGISGTRPVVATAVVRSLLEAGLPPNHIVVWDRRLSDLRRAGFVDLADRLGVECAGAEETGYDDKVFYESPILGTLIYGDYELPVKDKPGSGRKSFVSLLVTRRLTKIVNVSPLLVHGEAGVAGNLYSLTMGSVDNTQRFEVDSRRLTTAIPEIYAMEAVGDKVVFSVVDALICQYQGELSAQLHYSTTLDQLRFSKDPVALDVLSIKEIKRQRQATRMPAIPVALDIYANASFLELGAWEERKIEVQNLP